MLGPWETVWACTALTLLVLVVDGVQAYLKKGVMTNDNSRRQARQSGMKYTQLEDLNQ